MAQDSNHGQPGTPEWEDAFARMQEAAREALKRLDGTAGTSEKGGKR